MRRLHLAGEQDRILLTRDIGLLERSVVKRGYWLRETDPVRQLGEMFERFELENAMRPFTRCMHCNTLLMRADKIAVRDRVPRKTADLFEEFQSCPGCLRVYWKGSHYARMQQLIHSLRRPRLLQ